MQICAFSAPQNATACFSARYKCVLIDSLPIYRASRGVCENFEKIVEKLTPPDFIGTFRSRFRSFILFFIE